MEAKHTPGPLIVCQNDNEPDVLYIEQDREQLVNEEPSVTATVHLSGDGVDEQIGRANAHLYAAAPDLLAAGKAFVEARRKWRSDNPDETIDSIAYLDMLDAIDFDSAIAKATGTT